MAYIYDDSQTYTGEIVNFTSTDKAKITSVSVPLTYSQDLHGYANPWPAGGGVNKCSYDTDYTPTAGVNNNTINLFSLTLAAGTYTFSCKQSVNVATSTRNTLVVKVGSNAAQYENSGTNYNPANLRHTITFTVSEESTVVFSIWCHTPSTAATYNEWQVESGSFTAYSPYSNICPISGLTGLSVYRTGVNVWDEEWELGAFNNSTGAKSASSNTIRSKNPIAILPETEYCFVSHNAVYLYFYDANGDFLPPHVYKAVSGGKVNFTSPQNAFYMNFYAYGTSYAQNKSINYPSTDTDYQAYNGNTYAVDWSTQAGTVYHGTVDPVAGQLTVDAILEVFNVVGENIISSQINEFNKTSGSVGTIGDYTRISFAVRSGVDQTQYNRVSSGYNYKISNMLKHYFAYNDQSAHWYRNTVLYAFFPTSLVGSTAQSVYDYLVSIKDTTPLSVWLELATPLTYQLTPKQIAALTENYVWASNGASITVTVSDVLHDFQGWLLKVGSGMTLVPTEMIKAETYKVSPNQRMEETAERDSTGVLWRETVPNMPPKIEFNTPAAYDTDVNALNAIFRAAYSNEQERKLRVAFYDPEENVYKTWECYMPNIDFPIRTIDIDAKTIFYDEIRYAFIGY